ncbi:hypothetical protein [Paraburkholderia sp. BL21I4N1]|uniref:hypothetical protein n=1 Tax=Paraburkholderia sp. BL21I4N1 TaxID=1938801 RepID=UPI000D489949|nr:hypothetical protein [Paraburkholderia sp. BL21I4N1]PQV42736.1 hypothetical protein B0G83_1473 [Paraburkholderia sp. BL21I4N1]
MNLSKALSPLCRSAATSYSGSMAPEALLTFLMTGAVDADVGVLLRYAIEELPAPLWAKALADYDLNLRASMMKHIADYAVTQRLYLTPEMREWLSVE